jgi:predicted aconitase
MYITVEEEKMLQGEYGEAISRAMEILVTLGDVFDAEKLIDIRSVHMPGSSFVVSGLGGLKFVETFSKLDVRFKCFTTLNTAAIDFKKWENLKIPKNVVENQINLTESYVNLGAVPCHTCTPYFTENIVGLGEHCAWGESSAVIFINSIIGARTNREGGPSALASALTGKTPYYGFHLNENRLSDYLIKINYTLKDISDYGALGYYVGKIVGYDVPAFTDLPNKIDLDKLKALGAALASSGAVALYHIKGLTPEAKRKNLFKENKPKEVITVGKDEISESFNKLRAIGSDKIDLVCFGCPHCSIEEIREITRLLSGRIIKKDIRLWVLTSSYVKKISDRLGLTDLIEKSGGELICDTCPVLAPMKHWAKLLGIKTIATNSAKLAHYSPGQCNLLPYFDTMENIIKIVS